MIKNSLYVQRALSLLGNKEELLKCHMRVFPFYYSSDIDITRREITPYKVLSNMFYESSSEQREEFRKCFPFTLTDLRDFRYPIDRIVSGLYKLNIPIAYEALDHLSEYLKATDWSDILRHTKFFDGNSKNESSAKCLLTSFKFTLIPLKDSSWALVHAKLKAMEEGSKESKTSTSPIYEKQAYRIENKVIRRVEVNPAGLGITFHETPVDDPISSYNSGPNSSMILRDVATGLTFHTSVKSSKPTASLPVRHWTSRIANIDNQIKPNFYNKS